MTDQPLSAAARPAAEWWGEQVRAVKAESDGLHPELSAGQAYAATAQIALRGQALERAHVSDDIVEAFVDELARLVAASEASTVTLFTDYGPNSMLASAAEAVGLPWERLPLKTRAKVWPDHVLATAGYRAPWRLVWSTPGWAHPACGLQDWPEGSGDPVGPECMLRRWHDGGHDWQQGRRT